MTFELWRFKDLQERRIVKCRPTLHRWIKQHGFPPGRLIGPNSRAWTSTEILAWLDSRPVGLAVEAEVENGTAEDDEDSDEDEDEEPP